MTELRRTDKPLVIAVIPTFGADTELLTGLAAVAPQVHTVIVVDDGSPDDPADVLGSAESAGYTVIRCATNNGIAAALNRGVEAALALGADYVLTLDQDTVVPPDYVAACLAAFETSTPADNLGIVCTDRVNGQPSIPEHYTAEGLGLVREGIQSGFLISRACFSECGLFDERLFIDCVDTEFCLRIALFGFRIAVGPGTDIAHSLGEMVDLRPFGVPVRDRDTGLVKQYQYHGSVRRYFITRNNVDLWFRYANTRPRWVISAIKREIGPTATTVVAGPQRWRQTVATVAGFSHGFIRHRGAMAPGLRRILTPSRPR